MGVPTGTPYSWVFDIEMAAGDLFTGPFQASIKARYADNSGKKVGDLVSENITLMVPEPSAGALLGLGLGMSGLALFRPRRR